MEFLTPHKGFLSGAGRHLSLVNEFVGGPLGPPAEVKCCLHGNQPTVEGFHLASEQLSIIISSAELSMIPYSLCRVQPKPSPGEPVPGAPLWLLLTQS